MAMILKPKEGGTEGTPAPVTSTAATTTTTRASAKPLVKTRYEVKAHTIGAYGLSKTYKSWTGLEISKYTLQNTGKLTRVIYADQGGFADMKDASDGGLIQMLNLSQMESPSAAMMKIVRGEWPVRTGEALEFLPWESNGGPDEIGLYIFDSLTSIAEAFMQELINKRQQLSQDIVAAYEYYGEKFAAASQAHYGEVQRKLRNCLNIMPTIPVERIYWTALEGTGEEKLTKASILGPQTIGKALTGSIEQLTGDLWHLESAYVETPTPRREGRAWFQPHPSKTGHIWPAGLRLSDKIVEWQKKHPKGYILNGMEAGNSIVEYLQFRDNVGIAKVNEYKDMVEKFRGRKESE